MLLTAFPTMDREIAAAVTATAIPNDDFSDLPAARNAFDALVAPMLASLSYDGVELREIAAPGLDCDPSVTIRFLTPGDSAGPLPVLVWIHGGGFAVGTAQSTDQYCVEAVRRLGIAVANVEYRLAPEAPFPGPLNDCYAALRYVHDHAAALGIDPSRIAVGGQSAGGCLAAGVALKARDEGTIPVSFQYLVQPALDDRLTTPSMTDFVDTPIWNRPNAILSWQYYLGERYAGPSDPDVSIYAAPSRATDFRGLPATYISTMELDPLRDEGIAYAAGLLQAGVSVELHSFPGTFHGSALVRDAQVSKREIDEGFGALGRGLRTHVAAS
jgi:acetyl esterase/lipase